MGQSKHARALLYHPHLFLLHGLGMSFIISCNLWRYKPQQLNVIQKTAYQAYKLLQHGMDSYIMLT